MPEQNTKRRNVVVDVVVIVVVLAVAYAVGSQWGGSQWGGSSDQQPRKTTTEKNEAKTPPRREPSTPRGDGRLPPGHPPMHEPPAPVVLASEHEGNYTYLNLDAGGQTFWVATRRIDVKAGDRVRPFGMTELSEFPGGKKKTDGNRVFLADEVEVAGADGLASGVHNRTVPVAAKIEPLEKAPGGQTIAELYAAADKFAGKKVTVRGRVVKFTPGILSHNWMHLQDGSAAGATGDLTFTLPLETTLVKGQTVIATGTLARDKDFGAGYKYPLIVEDAKIVP